MFYDDLSSRLRFARGWMRAGKHWDAFYAAFWEDRPDLLSAVETEEAEEKTNPEKYESLR